MDILRLVCHALEILEAASLEGLFEEKQRGGQALTALDIAGKFDLADSPNATLVRHLTRMLKARGVIEQGRQMRAPGTPVRWTLTNDEYKKRLDTYPVRRWELLKTVLPGIAPVIVTLVLTPVLLIGIMQAIMS